VLCRRGESLNTAPDLGAYLEEVAAMTDFPMISPLSDLELDAVTGGNNNYYVQIRQNARGGDSTARGGNGGTATTGTGAATGGVGGAATAAAGGAGGMNTITV